MRPGIMTLKMGSFSQKKVFVHSGPLTRPSGTLSPNAGVGEGIWFVLKITSLRHKG